MEKVNFEFILSELQTPQGLKAPVLKKLYTLLVSMTDDVQSSRNWSFDRMAVDIDPGAANVKFNTIRSLSNLLFAELSVRFKQFFSGLDNVSTCEDYGMGVEVLLLLLRCCLILLLVFEPLFDLEEGQILMRILRKLCSVSIAKGEGKSRLIFEDLKISFPENSEAGLEFLELTNDRLSFISAVLEVFIDELVVHDKLREIFHLIDSAATSGENQVPLNIGEVNIGILVEVICCHFSLSLWDEKSSEEASNRLFWVNEMECKYPTRHPEVRLYSAASLFMTLIKLDAPRHLLAHMVFLVSEACSSMIRLGSFNRNHNLVYHILSIFERSVTLYREQVRILQIGSHSSNVGVFCSKEGGKSQYSFESHVSPIRKQKMDNHMQMLDKFSDGNLQNAIIGTKSELLSSGSKYVKECQTIMHMRCHDESLEILPHLIVRASDGFGDMKVESFQGHSFPDAFYLSSLLKLVGTSLQLAILCITYDDSGCCRTLEDIISCKYYDMLLRLMSCFEEYSIHLPVLQQLADCMDMVSVRHKGSRMMFITSLGLLSLAFNCGFDCLMKGCLLTMMATMNLFAIENDGLDALHQLIDRRSEETPSSLSLVIVEESQAVRTSSWLIASKFQKLSTLCSRGVDVSLPINSMGSKDGQSQALVVSPFCCGDGNEDREDDAEKTKTRNTEMFIDSMRRHQKNVRSKLTDFDDLVDFIEGTGIDYSFHLKERHRLRNRKWQKHGLLKWEKMKASWKQGQ